MANKQSRGVGELSRFQSRGSVSDAPDFAVDDSASGRALAAVAGGLAQRLSKMADHAAASEGEMAGLNAGQVAGERYLQKAAKDSQAAKKASGDTQVAKTDEPAVAPSMGPLGLSTVPLQLRHDNTIRGEAFDAAAMKAYGWRFASGLSDDMEAAYEANKDSPAGYEKAVAAVQKKYEADGMMAEPQVKELFDQTMASRLGPARLAIAARHEAAVAAAARAAAIDGVESLRANLERQAYSLGANPAADWWLKPEVEKALSSIDREVKDGTFSAAEGKKLKSAIGATVLGARTQGTFDNLPTPAAQQDFALSIMDDWTEGKGAYKDMSLDEAKRLSDGLYQQATVARNKLDAADKAEQGRVKGLLDDDVASIAGSGQGLDPVENGLDIDRVKQLVGEDGYADWQHARDQAFKGWQATSGMEAQSTAEISDRLDLLAPKPGQAGYEDQAKIYTSAVKHAQDVLEERQQDPLGQANAGGLVTLAPIDATSADALGKSLAARRQQADIVAGTYGTPPTYFRPEERASLSNALLTHPELIPDFAQSVQTVFGDKAAGPLSELALAGPELAHAAGVSIATGDNSVAADLARTLAAKRDGTFKTKMPTDNVMSDAAGSAIGDVFSQNDAARAAVAGVANLLFEKDANTLGFDPGDVNKPGSAAHSAYARAVDRAVGAHTTADGTTYGGITSVNGTDIVAPSFLPTDKTGQVLSTINDTDLMFLPPMASANGSPITATDLRGAHLVTIGDGLYRVALGDPQGFDPEYVATPAGDYWVLDLEQLNSIKTLGAYSPGSDSPLRQGLGGMIQSLTQGMDPK